MNFLTFRPHWYLKFLTVFALASVVHASPSPPAPPATTMIASSKNKCLFLSSMAPEFSRVDSERAPSRGPEPVSRERLEALPLDPPPAGNSSPSHS